MQPPTNNPNTYHPKRRYGLLLAWLILLATLGIAVANQQNIRDWWQLRSYQAPAAIAQIADQDTMTPYARKVFYVNQPAIEDKASFSQACAAVGGHEHTIILGCYHGNQGGIFVLDVNDPRLSGVEQVTAAHEMLHAAYDRLSVSDKRQIDRQLTAYYRNELRDQRILSTMEAYKKSEPNDLVNEMHSIFGTEITDLPAGLEEYYKRYFSNRKQVAAYASQYQSAFTSRQAALNRLEAQLNNLKSQIQNLEAGLKSKRAEIDRRQAGLVADRDSGNTAAYNAGVPGYNSLVDAYNRDIETLRNLISRFNDLVNQHNALVLEQSQLRDELDANAVPTRQ